jgi:hypothetical protein
MVNLNITLGEAQAAKLRRLAEQTNVREDSLAGSLLAHALDEMDADPVHVANVLDSVPGVFDRAQRGREQGRRGNTVPLDQL